MDDQQDPILSIASEILSSRMTRPSTMDTFIIDPNRMTTSYQFAQHPNKFVGSIFRREDGSLCFILAGRTYLEQEFDHVFTYYINHDYDQVQPSELVHIRRHVAKDNNFKNQMKLGIVNLRFSSNQAIHLSMLIEAVDYTISPRLIRDFTLIQHMMPNIEALPIGNNANNRSECYPQVSDLSEAFREFAKVTDNIHYATEGCHLIDPHIVFLSTGNHIVFINRPPNSNIINIIVTHPFIFYDVLHYERVKRVVLRWYPQDDCEIIVTRVYGNHTRVCTDDDTLNAWKVVYSLRPHIFLTIRTTEIKRIVGDGQSYEWPLLNNPLRFQIEKPSQVLNIPEECIGLVYGSQSYHPFQAEVRVDSQMTQIVDPNDWRDDLTTWVEVSRQRRRIRDSITPPMHRIEPTCDYERKYLRDLPSFNAALKLIEQVWNRYAPTIVFNDLYDRRDRHGTWVDGTRFMVFPLKTPRGDECIIIVDTANTEWVFFRGGNNEYNDEGYFAEILVPYFTRYINEIATFSPRIISITSAFHGEYIRLHHLMSLYTISRLFVYQTALPRALIYGEWEIRKYANDICVELQLANNQYNITNGLIDDSGYLEEEALESYPSSLRSVHYVVKKDQCMLCGQRYFSNLGRHMASKHGGQSSSAARQRYQNR